MDCIGIILFIVFGGMKKRNDINAIDRNVCGWIDRADGDQE